MNNFSPLTIAVAQLKRGTHAAGVSGLASRRTLVAQVSNLLFRRLRVGKASENLLRWAGWKPAIQQTGSLRYYWFTFVALALGVTGCTMSPKYSRPAAPIPTAWPAGPAYEKAAAASNAPIAPDLN
jgi:hypothetical protein